jgi:hypothetical protein
VLRRELRVHLEELAAEIQQLGQVASAVVVLIGGGCGCGRRCLLAIRCEDEVLFGIVS